jgi:hypothetical protein
LNNSQPIINSIIAIEVNYLALDLYLLLDSRAAIRLERLMLRFRGSLRMGDILLLRLSLLIIASKRNNFSTAAFILKDGFSAVILLL